MNKIMEVSAYYGGTLEEYNAEPDEVLNSELIYRDHPTFPGDIIADEFIGLLSDDTPSQAVLNVDPIAKTYSFTITKL